MTKHKTYQKCKISVVIVSYAVIQPNAMMIESFRASIASITMLCEFHYMSITSFTEIFIILVVKFLTKI